jgi:transposase InsO family protein
MCHPLTVQDDATRYVLCVDGHGSTSTEPVARSFERIYRDRGLPERIHSDNGVPFAGTGVGRLSRVSVEWMRQGIEVCRSRVGHPEDNPRHERMHRTLKARTSDRVNDFETLLVMKPLPAARGWRVPARAG